jgi:membrane fusion protein (multidrug efflux system)
VRVAVAEKENAILVPQLAVQELQGAKTVMIVDAENKAALRTVRLGDKADKNYIVLDGLSGGETVIVEGLQKVRPGGEVNATTAPPKDESTQKTGGS